MENIRTLSAGQVNGFNHAKEKTVVKKKKPDWPLAVLFCFPAISLLLVFRVFPLFFGIYISLFKWGVKREAFIGLNNYMKLLKDDLFYIDPVLGFKVGEFARSMLVTINYALFSIIPSLTLAFLVAYMLFYKFTPKIRAALRTVFFLPYITSSVSAILIFKWIFHPDLGIANAVLSFLHLPAQKWLTDPIPVLIKILDALHITWPGIWPIEFAGPTMALLVIVIYHIWSSAGFNIIIFLSGLSNVPKEFVEAAKIDGANSFQILKNVTIPMVSPTIYFLSIVSVIGAFETFNSFFIFSTGTGGPMGSTYALPLYIFNNFYSYNRTGYASALSVILCIIIFCLTLLQKKYSKNKVHYQE